MKYGIQMLVELIQGFIQDSVEEDVIFGMPSQTIHTCSLETLQSHLTQIGQIGPKKVKIWKRFDFSHLDIFLLINSIMKLTAKF